MWNFRSDYCERISQNADDIIKEEGYPLEKYCVTTEDGYINMTYRIPYGQKGLKKDKRPPVYLSHGLACSSGVFFNQSCLAYYLADEGFDVWMPNNRGTSFSRGHVKLKEDEDRETYWNFTLHEIGYYDTPAFIDFILQKTGFEQLYFIGHSQGACSFAICASERPEYNKKIALCLLLGPAVLFKRSFLTAKVYAFGMPLIETVHRLIDLPIYEMPGTALSRIMFSSINPNSLFHKLVQTAVFMIAGYPDYEQTSQLDFSKFTLTTPNAASVLQVYHYGQIMRSGVFGKFNHGQEGNMEHYGTRKPPRYNLSKITSPVAIFFSDNDMFCSPRDVENFTKKLGNVVFQHRVEDPKFNHMDFLYAKDVISLLLCHMTNLMQKYKIN